MEKRSNPPHMNLPFLFLSSKYHNIHCNQNKLKMLQRYAPCGTTINLTSQNIYPLHTIDGTYRVMTVFSPW